MGKITLPVGGVPAAFNNHLGQHGKDWSFFESVNEFETQHASQAAMDASLITYAADQANIDATLVQLELDEETQRVKDTFDDKERRLLRAFAEVIKDEINILRGQHGLADRTLAQLRTAIKNKVT